MPSKSILEKILTRAVNAPSGDNGQPWEFSIKDGGLLVHIVKDADVALFNFKQRGSFLALGAVLENITLLSLKEGYQSTVKIDISGDVVARVTFTPCVPDENFLCKAIEDRSTNRKPYTNTVLTTDDRAALQQVAAVIGAEFVISDEKNLIQTIAKTISLTDRLLIENRALHTFLFGIIRWSREEEKRKTGLYVDTMELPPPVKFLFRYVINRWPIAQVLAAVRFSHFIAGQTAQVYAATSAFGFVCIPDDKEISYIQAGRLVERIWLCATSRGLSLQPVTALPYLAQRIEAGEAAMFSLEQQKLIFEANKTIQEATLIPKDKTIAMIFRIGYADSPSARSYKKAPVIRKVN